MPSSFKQPREFQIRDVARLTAFRDHARLQDAVPHLGVDPAVLAHVLPTPENVAGQPMRFDHIEQAVDTVLHDDLRLADRFAAPFGKGQRHGWVHQMPLPCQNRLASNV